jgi:ABC-2 type transport system ATP-binding protein
MELEKRLNLCQSKKPRIFVEVLAVKTYINLQIILQNLGKRFNREWIFRNLHTTLQTGQSYVFVGPNGSGKSTLLQVLMGAIPHTEGTIQYTKDASEILQIDDWFRQMVLAAPYLELIEEFTLNELLAFHQQFKPFKKSITALEIAQKLGLESSQHKLIKYFSSGMKQRLKLGLAFYSDVPVVLLDEPTSNLDARWSAWYRAEVQQLQAEQLLIICSNVPAEYDFCSNVIDLIHYK